MRRMFGRRTGSAAATCPAARDNTMAARERRITARLRGRFRPIVPDPTRRERGVPTNCPTPVGLPERWLEADVSERNRVAETGPVLSPGDIHGAHSLGVPGRHLHIEQHEAAR